MTAFTEKKIKEEHETNDTRKTRRQSKHMTKDGDETSNC